MGAATIFSIIVRTAEHIFNHKSRQRRAAEAASKLVSVLDKYVMDCAAVAIDNGYSPFENPAHYDYRERKPQCLNASFSIPDIADWELLPLSFTDGTRALENRQRDTPDALIEAREFGDASEDDYYALRQKIFSTLGFRAVALARELRTTYHLEPPSSEHREREIRIENTLKHHDGYSKRLRRIEYQISRQKKSISKTS
ncbi:hypothetical protein [Pantoea agglomerans]|uniref:hypothetical protein n=1 Tax=Enterobacter agglomerans TaxID=549 RepID=UPI0028973F2E|nr:hypothetical protein [Pantoea agglomerans]WNK42624.1 hypothetical protein RM160_23245 [Pantoea agglomerans]